MPTKYPPKEVIDLKIVRSYRAYKADLHLKRSLVMILRALEWPRIKPGEQASRSGKLPGRVVLDRVDIEILSEPYRRKDEEGYVTLHSFAELLMSRPAFREFQQELRRNNHVDIDYDRTNMCFYLKTLSASFRQNRL
jgi:hypothetical protein